MFQCPAHEDRNPSLSVSYKDKKVLVYCHAGCKTEEVLAALGLTTRDLFDEPGDLKSSPNRILKPGQPKVVAEYAYRDADGTIISTKTRREPGPNGERKTFSWDHGNPEVLYRGNEIGQATSVHLCEGEKAVDALVEHGVSATCLPTPKWLPKYAQALQGKQITIWADRDETGTRKAEALREHLQDAGIAVKMVRSRTQTPGSDAYDHLDAGHRPEDGEPFDPFGKVVVASSIQPSQIEWILPGYLPRGKVAILDGDPGVGKTTVIIDLAARLTTGRGLPEASPTEPLNILMVSFEDDWADTLIPRFCAAGGDQDRLFFYGCGNGEGSPELFTLPDGLQELEDSTEKQCISLVLIDPLAAALSSKVKSGIDHEIRRALAPVHQMASRTRAAVLFTRHLNKNSHESNPLYRGGGSIGIIGAVRTGLAITSDPVDPSDSILWVTKSNLAPSSETPPLRFRIVSDPERKVSKIEWKGVAEDVDTSTLLSGPPGPPAIQKDRAIEFLQDFLAEGPRSQREVEGAAEENGIARATLRRAKKELDVRSTQIYADGKLEGWAWELGSTSNEQMRTL